MTSFYQPVKLNIWIEVMTSLCQHVKLNIWIEGVPPTRQWIKRKRNDIEKGKILESSEGYKFEQ